MKERTKLILIAVVFTAMWFLPLQNDTFVNALVESFRLLKWYAREHVLLCLVPAFFIAGAISVFVSQGAVMKYLGPGARKIVAYPVAAVSGTILAVCSCTVLPLFASIYKRGAGLGPATAFLYSGPAINIMAIILTARVLGMELGIARAVGAVVFSVVIGLFMHLIFQKEESEKKAGGVVLPEADQTRALWQDGIYFAAMLGILIFANFGSPGKSSGAYSWLFQAKWWISGAFLVLLVISIRIWFQKDELAAWKDASWMFAKQILPLLFAGVIVAGFLLGGPDGGVGVIPQRWIENMVGGNSIRANLFASVAGALMYFATLTEVPILEGLLNAGMGKGPALALLLAGPALSLPNMLVIRSVMGIRKTLTFVALVVVLSTVAGMVYGAVL
ncbi:MAG: permease [Deltaproteobacteria bacterium]|nr:permease [Deltaproteobacteria bacterium]MBN2670282.1 permease [Deltaproteobacteria bacterium]